MLILLELGVVLLLVLCNGLLAMSEIALISARENRLRQMAGQGVRGARMALRLMRDPNSFLSTVQIGITLVGIFAGAFSGATLGVKLGNYLDQFAFTQAQGQVLGIGIMVVLVTYLSLVVGELVPKRIALANPERIAVMVAPAMYRAAFLATPAVWLLRLSSDLLLRPLGLLRRADANVTEEEVRALIAEATRAGVFIPEETRMIDGVLRLADRAVYEVMTPRARIRWLDRYADWQDILSASSGNNSARLLVCDGDIDQPLGVVHTKDLLPVVLQQQEIALADLLTPVLIVSDDTSIMQLLQRFRAERTHVAVVVPVHETPENASIMGLVTLTDVMACIAGELPPPQFINEIFLLRRKDGSWLVDGRLPIAEFELLLRMDNLHKPGVETVAAFVLDHLGRVPHEGQSFLLQQVRVEIVDMDGQRIDKLIVSAEPGMPEMTLV